MIDMAKRKKQPESPPAPPEQAQPDQAAAANEPEVQTSAPPTDLPLVGDAAGDETEPTEPAGPDLAGDPAQMGHPWWEVQGGLLPKLDIQAPNAEAAQLEYQRRLGIRKLLPTAKRVG